MWQRILLACLMVVLASQSADAWRGRGRRFVRQAASSSPPQGAHDTQQRGTESQGPRFLGGKIYEREEPQRPAWLDLDVEEQEEAISMPFELQAPSDLGLAPLLKFDPAEMPFAPFEKKPYLANYNTWRPIHSGPFGILRREPIEIRQREPSERDIELLEAMLDQPLDLENLESIEWLNPLGIRELYETADAENETFRATSIFVPVNG